MKNNLFQNKEINLKRIRKGIAIGLPVVIMIFVIGNYYINLIDDSLRDKYQTEKIVFVDKEKVVLVDKEDVLGEKITIEEEFPNEFKKLTEDYGIEEYILNWDGTIDGYDKEYEYISSPKFYLSGVKDKVSETWSLNNGYKLVLDCPEIELSKVIVGDSFACRVEYNNQLINENVRYDIYSWEEGNSMPSYVSLVVYSSEKFEILVLGEYSGGSFDDISVYRLQDGKSKLQPFNYKNELKETWKVESSMSLGLYYNKNEDFKLVTAYHEPSMGPLRGVIREWNIGEEFLILQRTFGNIVD